LGREVEYTLYQEAGHGYDEWTWGDQVDVMNRIVRWFDDHLKDAGSRPGQTCPDPHLHGQAKKAETDRGARRC